MLTTYVVDTANPAAAAVAGGYMVSIGSLGGVLST